MFNFFKGKQAEKDQIIFNEITDAFEKKGGKELSRLMKDIRNTSDNFINEINSLQKKDIKDVTQHFKSIYEATSLDKYEPKIMINEEYKEFSAQYLLQLKINFMKDPENEAAKESFIYYSSYRNLLQLLADLLDEVGTCNIKGNSKNFLNYYFDMLYKSLYAWHYRIAQKSKDFFTNTVYDGLPDVNYGFDAASILLTSAEIMGKRLGLNGGNLNSFVQDDLISQGYLFHKFNNEYIKENRLLDMCTKYESFIFKDMSDFCDFSFRKTEEKTDILWFRLIRLIDSLIWAGISGTELSNVFENSSFPLGLIPVVSFPYRVAKNINRDLLINDHNNYFPSNSEENKDKLKEMIKRNIKSFSKEYILFEKTITSFSLGYKKS